MASFCINKKEEIFTSRGLPAKLQIGSLVCILYLAVTIEARL